jgi:hypothetical protein
MRWRWRRRRRMRMSKRIRMRMMERTSDDSSGRDGRYIG